MSDNIQERIKSAIPEISEFILAYRTTTGQVRFAASVGDVVNALGLTEYAKLMAAKRYAVAIIDSDSKDELYIGSL